MSPNIIWMIKGSGNLRIGGAFSGEYVLWYAANIGFAARLAGHWSNGHFIAVVLHLGWTYIAGLLFVNLYFYIFNQQRFRADEQ